jgi:biliverdin reductase/flavin reductase
MTGVFFLQVVKCDLMNPLELAKYMEGRMAVLSALGQPGLQISAMTFYEDSMKSIVTAMRNAKVKRLICVTSFYSKCKYCEHYSIELITIAYVDQPEKYPFIFKMAIRPMIGRHLDSMYVMEQYLEKECQDLDYTIVRPPRLLDERMIGQSRIRLLYSSF